ncbi:hypothetical protein TNCV_2017261 [Trichonephila clavipes]|nr:hypothetical protein TNCV_2017261 [Trichonephila clavipes]
MRCFSFRDGNPFQAKDRLLSEEDTTKSYSGFEPTRLQAEGHSHHTGWATLYVFKIFNYTQDQNKTSPVDLYLLKTLITPAPFWTADTGHRMGERNKQEWLFVIVEVFTGKERLEISTYLHILHSRRRAKSIHPWPTNLGSSLDGCRFQYFNRTITGSTRHTSCVTQHPGVCLPPERKLLRMHIVLVFERFAGFFSSPGLFLIAAAEETDAGSRNYRDDRGVGDDVCDCFEHRESLFRFFIGGCSRAFLVLSKCSVE